MNSFSRSPFLDFGSCSPYPPAAGNESPEAPPALQVAPLDDYPHPPPPSSSPTTSTTAGAAWEGNYPLEPSSASATTSAWASSPVVPASLQAPPGRVTYASPATMAFDDTNDFLCSASLAYLDAASPPPPPASISLPPFALTTSYPVHPRDDGRWPSARCLSDSQLRQREEEEEALIDSFLRRSHSSFSSAFAPSSSSTSAAAAAATGDWSSSVTQTAAVAVAPVAVAEDWSSITPRPAHRRHTNHQRQAAACTQPSSSRPLSSFHARSRLPAPTSELPAPAAFSAPPLPHVTAPPAPSLPLPSSRSHSGSGGGHAPHAALGSLAPPACRPMPRLAPKPVARDQLAPIAPRHLTPAAHQRDPTHTYPTSLGRPASNCGGPAQRQEAPTSSWTHTAATTATAPPTATVSTNSAVSVTTTTTATGKRGRRAGPTPRQPPTRIYKWKLCTGDTHLQYFTQFRRLANAFEESIWAYTVMHPSVMHEDTLRQSLLNSDESGAHPLQFNVNILVALDTELLTLFRLAARLIGDRNTEKEFYHRARTQLEDLFDSHTIEVAEGLTAMAYYALGEADFKQFTYYNTLALQMCQQLGAYHTDVFSRSLYIYLLDPSNSFQEKKALVRSLTSLGPAVPHGVPISALYCFFNSCPEISPTFAAGNALATTTTARASALQPPLADDPYARYLCARVAHIQNEQQKRGLYHQLRKSTIMATYTTNCTFLLTAYKAMRQQEAAAAAVERPVASGSDHVYSQIIENLARYEEDLVGLEDCSVAARLTSTLACFALWTEVHWESGHRERAKQSALRFVREVESFRHDISSLSCTSSMRFAYVCNILLQCGEVETLRRLLDLAEPWARAHTLGRQITTKFKDLLPPPPPPAPQRGKRKTAK